MKLICSDEKLITHFLSNNSLLDGKIEKIEIIDAGSSVCININFNMRSSSDYQKIQFKFVGCKGYSFSYSEDYYFYNIELLKFFQCEDGLFYISFDPCDETEVISDDDQDFILCRKISAYIY
ncbi:hypothetical protein F0225_01165 [Vibrio pectenicida]|uniref:Uncharacterized protein n=1 Tax=Vibrio pectenicida TaxID=62763 RepID=A0A7Y4ED09_9VIBR|nr:hypothetical protein [Vibrio pectenicida]NOH69952.1 hypothetical protein [Vibrio pectenicida]